MPKIPIFETTVKTTSEVPGVQTSLQAPMPGDFATKIQSTIVDYYVKEKQDEAKLKSLEFTNTANIELLNLHDKWKDHPIPSEAANGFQKEASAYIGKFTSEDLQNENNFTKRQTQNQLNATLSSLNLSVLTKSRDAFEKAKIGEEDKTKNIILTNTLLVPGYVESGQASNEIANYIDSNISDPNPDISVNKKKLKFDSWMSAVNTVKMEQDSNTQSNFLQRVTEDPSLYPGVPTRERLKIIEHAQANYNKRQTESLNATIKSIYVNSSFTEGADTIALLDAEISKKFPDPEMRDKAMKILREEDINRKKTFVDKGAGEYYINNIPGLNQEYALALQDNKRMPQFKQSLDFIYKEKNIPEQYRTYVPNNKVVEIVDTIKGSKNADQTLKTIQNLNQTYGPDIMPSLFKQLTKAGLDTNLQVGMSTNSLALQKDIFASASNKDLEEQAKKKLPTNALKAMENNIFEQTKDYRQIILNQKSGAEGKTEYLLSFEKTLYNAALNRVVNSNFQISPEKAVKDVTNEWKADYDTTQRTYFIPKDVNGVPVSIPGVKDKADSVLLAVQNTDYLEKMHGKDGFSHYAKISGYQNNLPENIKMSTPEQFDAYVKEKMISSMKKHSKWLLNNDSTGIVLHVELANGTIPITNAKGERIEFYFADMPNKNPKIKSTDMILPVTGNPLPPLVQDTGLLQETNYNIQ
jgi:hypothetical protein